MRQIGKPERTAGSSGVATVVMLSGTLCLVYMFSQFLRNSVGVIAPDIADELALSPEALGALSSAFFLSFALVQIPVGVAIDRFGPKRCMLASLGFGIAGCLIFAYGQSLASLTLARALMGLGCSTFFIAPLTIYARWFAPERFSTLTGIQLGIGTLGMLLATAPLAYSSALMGWRASFIFIALALIFVGGVTALVVRDSPPGQGHGLNPPESLAQSVKGLLEVVRTPGFAPVFAMSLVAYSSFVTVLGLWGGPYLSDVFGLDLRARGNVLLVAAAANVIGLLAWGPMDRLFGGRRRVVEVGALVTAGLFGLLGLFGDTSLPAALTILVILGLASAFVPVLTAHGRALFPIALVGRGMTMINIATVGGTVLLQLATAAVIGLFEPLAEGDARPVRPFAAYQAAFWLIGISLVIAWVWYRRAPDPRP